MHTRRHKHNPSTTFTLQELNTNILLFSTLVVAARVSTYLLHLAQK